MPRVPTATMSRHRVPRVGVLRIGAGLASLVRTSTDTNATPVADDPAVLARLAAIMSDRVPVCRTCGGDPYTCRTIGCDPESVPPG